MKLPSEMHGYIIKGHWSWKVISNLVVPIKGGSLFSPYEKFENTQQILVTFTCMTIFTPALGHFETHQRLTLLLSFSIKRSHLNAYIPNKYSTRNRFAKLYAQLCLYCEIKGSIISEGISNVVKFLKNVQSHCHS